MVARVQRLMVVFAACAAGWTLAAPLPREAAPLRGAYDAGLSSLESDLKQHLEQLANEYAHALGDLRDELQQAGRMRPLVTVQDEWVRFRKERQPGALSVECVELSDLQQVYGARVQQVRYSNEVEVVRLAERYVQALSEVRQSFLASNKADAVEAIDEERDRFLAGARIRQALQITRTIPAPAPGYASEADANATNALAGRGRSMKLYRMQGEDVNTVMGFSMTLEVIEDTSRLRVKESVAGNNRTRSEEGPVLYIPRVTVTCRNAEVPADAQLVIDYYSRSLTDNGFRKESLETVPLAGIGKGESATVEGRGLSLSRSVSVTRSGRGPDARSISGSELHGMILTVRDANRAPLLVRFSPQSLSKLIEEP